MFLLCFDFERLLRYGKIAARRALNMSHRFLTSLLLLAAGASAHADQILYQYDGDVLPYDASAGWIIFDPCEGPCTESMLNGQFVLNWNQSGNTTNYHYWLAQPPKQPPPPPFWIEWRFRSTIPKPPPFPSCDARFTIRYAGVSDVVYLFGDAAVSFEGGQSISGLELNVFHTFRLETPNGLQHTVSADGEVFMDGACCGPDDFHYFQFGGDGACGGPQRLNAWDYIRWGHLTIGESITATSPPRGFLDPVEYGGIDRFTITLSEPGYVHIDDVTVNVSSGDTPVVIKTWRKDGFTPRQVEIVLDRPLTVGETSTFTFAGLDPSANVVNYTLADSIPAASAWSAIVAGLAFAVAGTVIVRK